MNICDLQDQNKKRIFLSITRRISASHSLGAPIGVRAFWNANLEALRDGISSNQYMLSIWRKCKGSVITWGHGFPQPICWTNFHQHSHVLLILSTTTTTNSIHLGDTWIKYHCSLPLPIFWCESIALSIWVLSDIGTFYGHCSESYHLAPWGSTLCNPNDSEWWDHVGECNRSGRLGGADGRAPGTHAAILFFFLIHRFCLLQVVCSPQCSTLPPQLRDQCGH